MPAQQLTRLSDKAPLPNTRRNLYFGELHLHSEQSFDSVLFGNRLTIDDAYTAQDWSTRAHYEPLAEIYQVKGASECAIGATATIDVACSDGLAPDNGSGR